MDDETNESATRVGLIRPRKHCTFTWHVPEAGGQRSVQVRTDHCPECIAELRRLGYLLTREDLGKRYEMGP